MTSWAPALIKLLGSSPYATEKWFIHWTSFHRGICRAGRESCGLHLCKHPRIIANTIFRQVVWVQFHQDGIALQAIRDHSDRSTASKRIQNRSTDRTAGLEAGFHERRREGRKVCAGKSCCGKCPDIAKVALGHYQSNGVDKAAVVFDSASGFGDLGRINDAGLFVKTLIEPGMAAAMPILLADNVAVGFPAALGPCAADLCRHVLRDSRVGTFTCGLADSLGIVPIFRASGDEPDFSC